MGHSNLLSFNMPPISKSGLLGVLSGAGGGGGLGLYQELARTTLGSTSTTLDVSYDDKPYLMFLIDWARETGASADPLAQLGDTSADNGNNYSRRLSADGGSDSTNTSVNYFSKWATGSGSSVRNFEVMVLANNADLEKPIIVQGNFSASTGSSSAPSRTENVGKWANTSVQAGYFSYNGTAGTTFSTGSEVVVLGYDPADTSGDSVWEELASVELTGSASVIDSGTITAKKYLWVEAFTQATGGATGDGMRFQSDSGDNYSQRKSADGGSDSTATSTNRIAYDATGSSNDKFTSAYIVNNADEEKLVIGELNQRNTSGSGSAPRRSEFVGKWANTSNSITSVQIVNLDAGDFASGSILKVWGFD